MSFFNEKNHFRKFSDFPKVTQNIKYTELETYLGVLIQFEAMFKLIDQIKEDWKELINF